MATADIVLTIHPEPEISLTVTEAKLKPEQSKTVTPAYETQTVLPDAGMTLGSVTVEPIPDPTDRMTITENGSYDVARIGTADVDVQPTLQTRTVEPKEYGQTIRADSMYDGLEQVNVLRIPEWYVVPQGSLEVTANGSYDVTEKKTVNVAVPVPTLPDEYVFGGGSFVDKTAKGYYVKRGATVIKQSTFQSQLLLETVDIPDTVEVIETSAFNTCRMLDIQHLPASLREIGNYAFWDCQALTEIHFHSTPTIGTNIFWACRNLLDIYVPWSEGEVANAPWGATNATIHYKSEE